MKLFSLADEKAIVMGGGSGVGAAIAKCLVLAGARVVICGRREAVLRESCAQLGERASYIVHDATDTAQAGRLAAAAADGNGGPATILVNNAGIHLKKPALDETSEECRKLFDIHVLGSMALARRPGWSRAGGYYLCDLDGIALWHPGGGGVYRRQVRCLRIGMRAGCGMVLSRDPSQCRRAWMDRHSHVARGLGYRPAAPRPSPLAHTPGAARGTRRRQLGGGLLVLAPSVDANASTTSLVLNPL